MKIRLKQIEKRIDRIQSELIKIDAMRPGSLTRQYKDPKQQTGAFCQFFFDVRSGEVGILVPTAFLGEPE